MILAIDPGDRNTGWARSDGACGTIVSSKELCAWDRIRSIRTVLTDIAYGCDVVVIEEGYRRRALIMLVGFLAGWLSLNSKVVLTMPSQWVKQLFGKDKAGKYKQCALTMAKKVGFKPKTQHAADAVCLLEWYKRHEDKS